MDYDFNDYSEDPLKSFNPYSKEIQILKVSYIPQFYAVAFTSD